MLGATLGFLGVSFTHCTGPRPKCRILLHLGWFLMSIMMIIGLLLSVILVPVGVMLSETCTWMSDFFEDEVEFNDPSYTFLPPDIMSKISVCKFGDGNLSDEFAIGEELATIDAMLDSINVTLGLTDPDSEHYVDLSAATTVMTGEKTIADNTGKGEIADSAEETDDHHDVSLANLNKWADSTDLADGTETY